MGSTLHLQTIISHTTRALASTFNLYITTQALEAVASHFVEALANIRGEGTPSRSKGCSFKEFYKHHFPMFKGNLNSGEARVWLTRLEELLRVMDYFEE